MRMRAHDGAPCASILFRQIGEPTRNALLRLVGRKGCRICYKTGRQRSKIRGACIR
jgi:hypothetical protein